MLLRDDDDDDVVKRDLILEQYLPYRLAVLGGLMSQGFAKRYSDDFDLSIGEWRVIANLGHKEPLSANEIGPLANLDKVQMSRAVGRLEKKQLIRREGDTIDRRRTLLRLTSAGRDVYGLLGQRALEYEADITAALTTEEYAALDRILRKLAQRASSLR